MESAATDLTPLFEQLATGTTTTVKIFILLTLMSFSSAILVSITSFTQNYYCAFLFKTSHR